MGVTSRDKSVEAPRSAAWKNDQLVETLAGVNEQIFYSTLVQPSIPSSILYNIPIPKVLPQLLKRGHCNASSWYSMMYSLPWPKNRKISFMRSAIPLRPPDALPNLSIPCKQNWL